MTFEFATAARIVFGPGAVRQVPAAAGELGSRVLIVTGRSVDRASPLAAALDSKGFATVFQPIEGEPEIDAIQSAVENARTERCDLVIAFGGGSAIDAGKAIAALLTNTGDPLDYLEVVGRGQALSNPSAPFIAIPTTAGTGSEVTRNAVLASREHHVKASLRSPHMLPRLAVVDPDLTLDLPPAITASTGLDALTQLIEPYVSTRANAMTDMFCTEGIRRVAKSLMRALRSGSDLVARTDMSMASLLGGLSLANAGLGVVHGFAAPIGGGYPAPHGAVCAALLPHGMDANIRALRERADGSPALERYVAVARMLTGSPDATAEDGVAWVSQIVKQLGIPALTAYGMTPADLESIVDKAAKASSMKANPIVLKREELLGVVSSAL